MPDLWDSSTLSPRPLLLWAGWRARLCLAGEMKTTRYFEQQVLRKRPYIKREWCEQALLRPARKEAQPDGRVRHWAYVAELGKYLRVVTLEDGATVHNAFFDRHYKEVER